MLPQPSEDLEAWLSVDPSGFSEPERTVHRLVTDFWHQDFDQLYNRLEDLVEDGEPTAIYLYGLMTSFEGSIDGAARIFRQIDGPSPERDRQLEMLKRRDDDLCPVIPEEGSFDYDNGYAFYAEGAQAAQAGDEAGAESAWRLGALHGNVESVYGIALQAARRGDLITAEAYWTHIGALGYGRAMVSLATLFQEQGKMLEAKYWWERAYEKGMTQARNALEDIAGDERLADRLHADFDRWYG